MTQEIIRSQYRSSSRGNRWLAALLFWACILPHAWADSNPRHLLDARQFCVAVFSGPDGAEMIDSDATARLLGFLEGLTEGMSFVRANTIPPDACYTGRLSIIYSQAHQSGLVMDVNANDVVALNIRNVTFRDFASDFWDAWTLTNSPRGRAGGATNEGTAGDEGVEVQYGKPSEMSGRNSIVIKPDGIDYQTWETASKALRSNEPALKVLEGADGAELVMTITWTVSSGVGVGKATVGYLTDDGRAFRVVWQSSDHTKRSRAWVIRILMGRFAKAWQEAQ